MTSLRLYSKNLVAALLLHQFELHNMPASRQRPTMPCPLRAPTKPLLALGLEGSANKLGVGLILHSPPSASSSSPSEANSTTWTSANPSQDPGTVSILSNIRHTYVTPPGEGFLPSDTARHHKRWIVEVVERALKEGGKTMEDVDVVCFTKGSSGETVARGRLGAGRMTDGGMLRRTWDGSAVADCSARREDSRFVAFETPRRSKSLRWSSVSLLLPSRIATDRRVGVQTSKQDDSSLHRRRPLFSTFPEGIHRSSRIRNSGTGSSGRRLTSQWGTAWIGAYFLTVVRSTLKLLRSFARIIGLSNDPSPGANIEQEAKKYAPVSWAQIPPNVQRSAEENVYSLSPTPQKEWTSPSEGSYRLSKRTPEIPASALSIRSNGKRENQKWVRMDRGGIELKGMW